MATTTPKVKVNLPIYAELRELNANIDAEEKTGFDAWVTPEFVTMAGVVGSNLLMVAMVLGWLTASEVETLTKAMSAIFGAAEVILVNGLLVWKFIHDRTALRAEVIHAKYRLMESVAVERLRDR